MRDFFDVLWCQRYGVIGNSELRGVNPIACYGCNLKSSCIGLSNISRKKVFVENDLSKNDISKINKNTLDNVHFICSLENNVPKKVYQKREGYWVLTDEFSGYIMTDDNKLNQSLVDLKIITVSDFVNN